MKKPVSFDDLYPGRFLKAGNFGGKKVTLTIADYDIEELEGDDGKKTKAIITFRETKRQLVACKTNGICMREMFGTELPKWVGKRVILFPSEWNNEPCIRVWGSPDIGANFDVEIKLPRRKPFRMTMHRNGVKATAVEIPVEEEFRDEDSAVAHEEP
jgi:hypothetical protein